MGLQVVSKEGFGAAYARGLAANWSMASKWCVTEALPIVSCSFAWQQIYFAGCIKTMKNQQIIIRVSNDDTWEHGRSYA